MSHIVETARAQRLQTIRYRQSLLKAWMIGFKKRTGMDDDDFLHLISVTKSGALKTRLDCRYLGGIIRCSLWKIITEKAHDFFQILIDEGPNCPWITVALGIALKVYCQDLLASMGTLWSEKQKIILDSLGLPDDVNGITSGILGSSGSEVELCDLAIEKAGTLSSISVGDSIVLMLMKDSRSLMAPATRPSAKRKEVAEEDISAGSTSASTIIWLGDKLHNSLRHDLVVKIRLTADSSVAVCVRAPADSTYGSLLTLLQSNCYVSQFCVDGLGLVDKNGTALATFAELLQEIFIPSSVLNVHIGPQSPKIIARSLTFSTVNLHVGGTQNQFLQGITETHPRYHCGITSIVGHVIAQVLADPVNLRSVTLRLGKHAIFHAHWPWCSEPSEIDTTSSLLRARLEVWFRTECVILSLAPHSDRSCQLVRIVLKYRCDIGGCCLACRTTLKSSGIGFLRHRKVGHCMFLDENSTYACCPPHELSLLSSGGGL